MGTISWNARCVIRKDLALRRTLMANCALENAIFNTNAANFPRLVKLADFLALILENMMLMVTRIRSFVLCVVVRDYVGCILRV
jgi:hypothetical protein